MKKLFTLFAFVIIGLTACQETKESVIQQEQQITERHSCCDTTKMDTLLDGTKGVYLPYVTNRTDWYQQPCEEECFDFDHNLGNCDDNPIIDCLNEDLDNCVNKTAISSWICLGTVDCLPYYCKESSYEENYLYLTSVSPNCYAISGSAFFEINPAQYCETMDCISQMGIDYLYDNRTLYTCNNNTRPIIEYQLVAKTSGVNECQCFPGWEVKQGYNAELWVKIWCCND